MKTLFFTFTFVSQIAFAQWFEISLKPGSPYSAKDNEVLASTIGKLCPELIEYRALLEEQETSVSMVRVDQNIFDKHYHTTFSYTTNEGSRVSGHLQITAVRGYSDEILGSIEIKLADPEFCGIY